MPAPLPVASGAKRRKVGADSQTPSATEKRHASRIFAPFRTLGHVTSAVPFAVSTLGQSFVITTVVGTAFQMYDAASLHLLFVSSPPTTALITGVSTQFHFVYAIWGSSLGVFRRGRLEYAVDTGSDTPLRKLLVFGSFVCVATDDAIYVFRFASADKATPPELYTTIVLPPGVGSVVKLVHPHTYLNKIVVATVSYILLFNVRTGTLVFQSTPFTDALLTDIDSAPALDTLGLVFDDGTLQLYNLRYNKVLFELSCQQRTTSVSFRSDGSAHIVVGTADGDLYFYDLNRKRRVHILRDVHTASHGGVVRVAFLNGQPVFVTAGGDNSLREYVFDPEPSTSTSNLIVSSPRTLRSRAGHSLPPTHLVFADDAGHFLISASRDRSLWLFSLRKDAQSHEFSQRESVGSSGKRRAGAVGSLREKFPEITALAYEATKKGEWENVVTAHVGEAFARTWDADRGIVGRFRLASTDKTTVSTVGISFCGNFAMLGSAAGSVDIYNLQSGQHRRRIRAHRKAVTGVAVDGLNRTVITASADGEVQFREFKTLALVSKLSLSTPAMKMLLHRATELIAVALANNTIVVLDLSARRVVRELRGHAGGITAFDFSADGRWIVSASEDSTVRTWDLPTGSCVDAAHVASVVTALRVSGDGGEWLATAHRDGVGINLWTNRTLFREMTLARVREVETEMGEPTLGGEGAEGLLCGAIKLESDDDEEEDEEEEASGTYMSPEQLDPKLVTLTTLPRTRYSTLANLDIIKARNKPIAPPKQPEKVPFFLTLGGNATIPKEEVKPGTATVRRKKVDDGMSVFQRALIRAHAMDDYTDVITHLKSLSPAATDLELRTFATSLPPTPSAPATPAEMTSYFIRALTFHLTLRRDYDLVHAWMALLLRVHGGYLMSCTTAGGDGFEEEVAEALRGWKKVEERERGRVDELVGYCNGVINFLRLE
ncbi:Utp21 specific WD40 associated putative domain-containing protein [Limtongia smithiae]|uniref:Utp21 specific WD40 associated putative domain-containing protein n=1 Tax=Limtongia smithiae TaxID=1125753 RepID=UPI0034CF0086